MQRQVMEEYEKDYQNPKDVLNVENKKEKKVENEEEDNPYIKKIRIMKGIIALLIVIIITLLYLNALKYAITFEHNSIQNMSIKGFKNNGLICNNETLKTTLFIELNSLKSNDPQLDKYRYYLEKIDNLICDSSNERQLAYIQVQNMLPFLKKYVSFDNVKESFVLYGCF